MSVKIEPDKIWVTVTEKINLGNYSNVEIQMGMSKAYSEKDNPKKMISTLTDELQELLEKKSKKIRKSKK